MLPPPPGPCPYGAAHAAAVDFPLIGLVALLQVLLLSHGKQRLCIRILGGLAPAVHLLWIQTPFPAVGAQFRGVQAGGSRSTVNLSAGRQSSGSF